ncbi:hypothetical protein GGS26DRAFT_140301 [Hypomontagnella submonticulosa]|nr:hypothetical protein GGS26DRAFT_140301 [Hypomontagnella submonticulosa]
MDTPTGMDTSNLVAAWLSFAVTTVGLGGLISQASAINDQLDPFHANRTAEYLGVWFQRQQRFPWWKITKPPPLGPVITARMADGFCGVNVLHVTRIPIAPPGKAGWSTILAMFNHEVSVLPSSKDSAAAEKADSASEDESIERASGRESAADVARSASWGHIDRKALKRHQSHACIVISRTTLITMLAITNGRPVFQYSDACGFRAGYASYCGQWYITWSIGEEAVVKFASHDSIGKTEVLPRSFAIRVDRCGQIVSGVVSSPTSDFAVAFCGRKEAGTYRLEHAIKGFQGAHSGRHLYNMMGGQAFQVDFLHARAVVASPSTLSAFPSSDAESANSTNATNEEGVIVLELPSKDDKKPTVKMLVPPAEEEVLKQALDSLPWTSLSWSAHRGLRDMLLAYGKPIMDAYRTQLADLLRKTVEEQPDVLRTRGWDAAFVRNNMAHMAASAVLAGQGNSGDSVRVVTDIAAVYVGDWDVARLDEVEFWRREDVRRDAVQDGPVQLDAQGVVALTKFFVLEWSQEFDYQLYHHLPISLYFA